MLGKNELSPTQVRAAEILIRKVLPDLSTHHIEGHIDHGPIVVLSDNTFADWLRARLAEPAPITIGGDQKALTDGSVQPDLVGTDETRH